MNVGKDEKHSETESGGYHQVVLLKRDKDRETETEREREGGSCFIGYYDFIRNGREVRQLSSYNIHHVPSTPVVVSVISSCSVLVKLLHTLCCSGLEEACS